MWLLVLLLLLSVTVVDIDVAAGVVAVVVPSEDAQNLLSCNAQCKLLLMFCC